MSILSSIIKDTPTPIAEVRRGPAAGAVEIVNRCLAKDVEDRYQTAKDLRNDLRALKNELTSGEVVPITGSAETQAPVSARRSWRTAGDSRGAAVASGGLVSAAVFVVARAPVHPRICYASVRLDQPDAADDDRHGAPGRHVQRRPLRRARDGERRSAEPVSAAGRDDQQRRDCAAGRGALCRRGLFTRRQSHLLRDLCNGEEHRHCCIRSRCSAAARD